MLRIDNIEIINLQLLFYCYGVYCTISGIGKTSKKQKCFLLGIVRPRISWPFLLAPQSGALRRGAKERVQ